VVGVVYAEGVGGERIEALAEQSIARRNHVERKVDKSRLVEIVNRHDTAQALGVLAPLENVMSDGSAVMATAASLSS
jgi:hypothetical protein